MECDIQKLSGKSFQHIVKDEICCASTYYYDYSNPIKFFTGSFTLKIIGSLVQNAPIETTPHEQEYRLQRFPRFLGDFAQKFSLINTGKLLPDSFSENFMQTVLQNQAHKVSATHATEFDPPIYNVWRRQEKIFDLWLSCHTQDEIAGAVDTPRQTVARVADSFAQTVFQNQMSKASATHATEFDLEKF